MEEPPWAQVFARVIAGESIRSVALAFGTNPRRVRRALARAGLRVGGAVVGAHGVAALASHRSRLGTAPDAQIARAAGVTPEAVQGERRRMGIAAFRPARRAAPPPITPRVLPPTLAARPPVATPPRMVRPPASQRGHDPVVVRKSPRDGEAVRRITARLADRPEASPVAELPPRVARGVTTFRANEPVPVVAPFIPAFTPRPRTEREEELDRLLSVPRRDPDQRKRIVRAETRPFELVSRPGPAVTPAPSRRSTNPAWRTPDPAVLRELTARAEAEAPPVRPAAAVPAGIHPPAIATPMVMAVVRQARPAPAALPPAPAVAPPPVVAAPPVTVRVAPAAAPLSVATTDTFAGQVWAVHFEGLNEIVHICADDVVQALAVAHAWLPADCFPVVAIEAV